MHLGAVIPAGAAAIVASSQPAPVTKPTVLEQIVGAIPQLLSAGFSVAQANNVIKINKNRLAQGLPPLTMAEMQSLQAGTRVDIGLPPEVKTALLWGGLGLGAILLLMVLRK